MKRKITTILLLGIVTVALTGCQCKHAWQDATCTSPKICTKCGEIEGEALGHAWQDATCETARTCTVCGETEGVPLNHNWTEQTCTMPKTCTFCGATTGEALGHDWEEATCEKAKTCKLCGETEGDALPHTVETWKTIVTPTCSEVGKSEGVCQCCGQTVTEDIPKTEHTPGKWEIVSAATENQAGTREIRCTVCGKQLEIEEYTLTPEEIKAAYIAECGKYTYREISRNPGEYKGKKAKFSGQVIQVMQDTYGSLIAYTLRVNVSGYNTTVYVNYYASKDDPRILDKDRITMYGVLDGEKTYTTVRGDSITIPMFEAEYIDLR